MPSHPFQQLATFWLDTPAGVGLCFGVLDYGAEHDLIWVVADDKSGRIVSWPNPKVRFIPNHSLEAPRAGELSTASMKRPTRKVRRSAPRGVRR